MRVLKVDDWPVWRELRLAALADAPSAFGSRLADWQGDGDRPERWRGRLALPGSYNVVAVLDGEPVGMASGVPTDVAGQAELISMWVAPAGRGRGVGDRLVDAITQWAVGIGATELRLGVVEDNAPAIGLYRRAGFRPTGEIVGVMPDGVRREVMMIRDLPGPGD
ncbi:GNAT family N-acetyltransferase [Micromonospora zhanjiangensis]|uniref:GNAT family N-acetyltransferase n=1 Tax=Micromonospora zhanjiangensis TaxID=1522057 RepID=A0ABV8KV11_9ACTN